MKTDFQKSLLQKLLAKPNTFTHEGPSVKKPSTLGKSIDRHSRVATPKSRGQDSYKGGGL